MRTFESYIKNVRKQGRSYFTSAQALSELKVSRNALNLGVHKLKKKGDLISPARNLYIIVPPEDQVMGSLPAEQLVPILMNHWEAPYYVCLLTAAMYHGASHQKPQVFQVMTTRRCRPLICGKIKISFYYKKSLEDLPIQNYPVRTGYLRISSPEMTTIDMLLYPHNSGNLNNIATVLSELIDCIDPKKLIDLASLINQKAWLQRLGYILESIDSEDNTKKDLLRHELETYVQNLKLDYIPLMSESPSKGFPRNRKWMIVENTTLESDYDS